jgi:methyl-accepting chemotaxis protein
MQSDQGAQNTMQTQPTVSQAKPVMNLKTLFIVLLAVTGASFIVLAAANLYSTRHYQVHGTAYTDIVQGKDLIADILPPPGFVVEAYLNALQMQGASTTQRAELMRRFSETRKEFQDRHDLWKKSSIDADTKAEMAAAYSSGIDFYDKAESAYLPAIESGNAEKAASALADMKKLFNIHRAHVVKSVDLANVAHTTLENTTSTGISRINTLQTVLVVLALLIALSIGAWLMRFTLRSMDNIAKVAGENLRIRIALDNVRSAVTVSDENNVLIYMNRAGQTLFDRLAAKHGGSKSLIGNKLSGFLEEGEFKSAFTANLTETHVLEGVISGRKMLVEPSPVRDDNGVYVGRVTQWQDRTEEAAVELEIAEIIEAAAHGDFSHRIDPNGKSGFFRSLADGINRFIGETETGMTEIARIMKSLADGDLSSRMEGSYSGTFGQLQGNVNSSMAQLSDIVLTIRESADSMKASATQIASGNADLSSRTESQAAAIEETAAAMEELTSTVKMNAGNSRQASDLAHDASSVAVAGGEAVDQVVNTMGTIAASSHKIADIISVIDGIAFQTNILALNAAVEAARAGEQGRGFAVVATEVRNLAQRSSQAAKEIKTLIEDSNRNVEEGYATAAKAGETMSRVVTSVQQVSGLMSEISSASTEQSQGIEQVNIALAQMDETTQQNTTLVGDAASAARSMETLSSTLVNAVSFFQADESQATGHGKQERRSPNRATNVARMTKPRNETWSESASPARKAASGGASSSSSEGDWEVF